MVGTLKVERVPVGTSVDFNSKEFFEVRFFNPRRALVAASSAACSATSAAQHRPRSVSHTPQGSQDLFEANVLKLTVAVGPVQQLLRYSDKSRTDELLLL